VPQGCNGPKYSGLFSRVTLPSFAIFESPTAFHMTASKGGSSVGETLASGRHQFLRHCLLRPTCAPSLKRGECELTNGRPLVEIVGACPALTFWRRNQAALDQVRPEGQPSCLKLRRLRCKQANGLERQQALRETVPFRETLEDESKSLAFCGRLLTLCSARRRLACSCYE